MAKTMQAHRCRSCDASSSIGYSLGCGDTARSIKSGRAGQVEGRGVAARCRAGRSSWFPLRNAFHFGWTRPGRRPAAGGWLLAAGRAGTQDSEAPRVPPAAIRGQRLRAELAGRAGTSGWPCWLVELARSAGRAGWSSCHDWLVGERSAGQPSDLAERNYQAGSWAGVVGQFRY